MSTNVMVLKISHFIRFNEIDASLKLGISKHIFGRINIKSDDLTYIKYVLKYAITDLERMWY